MSHSITIAFVHGWGMNSAVWAHCTESLPDWIRVILVDLPGHGELSSKEVGDFNSMVNNVAATVNEPVIWVGWSLGGLVCLRLAELFPKKVLGLCLVATNPCFVKKEGWQCAIDKGVFDDFSTSLKYDIDKTIKRFLALQATGSKTIMKTVKELHNALRTRGHANPAALNHGLNALSEIDVRDSLQHIELPVQWILGSRDSLVPVELAGSLRALSPESEVIVVDGAAHAPFISHQDVFTEALIHFASGVRESYAASS